MKDEYEKKVITRKNMVTLQPSVETGIQGKTIEYERFYLSLTFLCLLARFKLDLAPLLLQQWQYFVYIFRRIYIYTFIHIQVHNNYWNN